MHSVQTENMFHCSGLSTSTHSLLQPWFVPQKPIATTPEIYNINKNTKQFFSLLWGIVVLFVPFLLLKIITLNSGET